MIRSLRCGAICGLLALTPFSFTSCASSPAAGETSSSRDLADHARALSLAKTGYQNVWLIHPALESAGISACLTDCQDGVRLLVWNPPGRTLFQPVAEDVLGALRDEREHLPADSPAVQMKGYPQFAFLLSEEAGNDFAARVFREWTDPNFDPAGFRFQRD